VPGGCLADPGSPLTSRL